MRNIKKIFIVVFSLILLFAVSCSNDDKTGINNNPPEDTEITDGETRSDGTGSGSETETTVTIDAKDFPADLLGQYRDDKVHSKYPLEKHNTLFYRITTGGTEVIIIKGTWLKDINTGSSVGDFRIEKWTKTTKGGKTIKLEGKDSSGKEATVTYDYETKTLSGTHTDGTGATYSFNGKKIGEMPF